MVMVYVNLYEKELRTEEQIPELWREDVVTKLKERGTYKEKE